MIVAQMCDIMYAQYSMIQFHENQASGSTRDRFFVFLISFRPCRHGDCLRKRVSGGITRQFEGVMG